MAVSVKKTISVLVVFMLLLTSAPFSAFSDVDIAGIFGVTEASAASSGTCGESIFWTLNNGTLTITGQGKMTDYYHDSPNVPWDIIEVKKIIVSEGVTHIGNAAFHYMNSLTEVQLPSTLKSIGIWAFASCTSLKRIDFPENLDSIGSAAFYWCTALETVKFPKKLSEIDYGAFEWCASLKEIDFSDGKMNVRNEAFRFCKSLEEVYIPAGVTFEGPSVFTDCTSLKSITVDKNNITLLSENGVLFNKNKTILMCYPAAKTDVFYKVPKTVNKISDHAFRECKSIKYINIPSGVKEIGSWAFLGCSSLVAVNLPDGIRVLSDYLFSGCSSLAYVNIPSGVETIDYCVFSGCASLHSLYIPKSVKSISGSFSYRTLQNIYYEGSITEWNNIIDVIDADNIENATIHYNYSFDKDVVFASGTCGSSVSWSLGNNGVLTISGKGNMTDFSFADSVPWYKHRFNVRKIVIEKGVTSIGNYAFNGCVFASSISIPGGVFYIGQSAFYECVNIVELDLPDGVTMIGSNAVENCCSLESIYIPESVINVGNSRNLYGNVDIYYAGSEKDWQDKVTGSFGENGKPHFNFKYAPGYIDEDNVISAADARLVLRASVGLEELSARQRKAADIDKDLNISAADARIILRASVGLEKLS